MSFTPEHSAALLAFIASVDPRLTFQGDTSADLRCRTWATILQDVPPTFALQHARRWYSRPDPARITPGAIRGAWVNEQRLNAARAPDPGPVGVEAPASLMDYMRAVLAATLAGRDPAEVPRPVSARRLSKAQDEISRRCRYWQNCPCPHASCRDGWLDTEDTILNAHGLTYPAVRACPSCRDAALMTVEFKQNPRARQAARR